MKAKDRELLAWFRQLNAEHQNALLSYAEFLCSKQQTDVDEPSVQVPLEIPAAPSESVVGALKRLSKSYFMLESTELLNRASTLMAQHVMQGREALEVIAELEEMFGSAYQGYRQAHLKKQKNRTE